MAEHCSSEYAASTCPGSPLPLPPPEGSLAQAPPTPEGSLAQAPPKPEASLPPTPVATPSTPQGSLAQAPPTPEGSLAQSQASDAVAAVQSNAIVALGGRAAAWQRCKRIYADPDAPPLLKQQWEEAQVSKKAKADLFKTFVSCGGNAGRMLCAEQKKWSELIEDEDEACWLTRDDLLQKYHGRVEKVDALIATKPLKENRGPITTFPRIRT